MERLPYIDEHARSVDANRERAWKALLKVMSRDPAELSPPRGFRVESAEAPTRLALTGQHWFSRYTLVFDLDEEDRSRTVIRARSWAEFPGVHGKIYRALVIGSGGHRIIMRNLLRRIAAAA